MRRGAHRKLGCSRPKPPLAPHPQPGSLAEWQRPLRRPVVTAWLKNGDCLESSGSLRLPARGAAETTGQVDSPAKDVTGQPRGGRTLTKGPERSPGLGDTLAPWKNQRQRAVSSLSALSQQLRLRWAQSRLSNPTPPLTRVIRDRTHCLGTDA